MKHNIVFTAFTAAVIVAGSIAFAGDDVPKPQAFARYEPMMKRSPFAVATAVALPAATPNFAKDLYIANAARTADGDLVTLASSTDKNFKKYLTTKAPVEGYSIPSIEWSDRVGQTKVTISKDGQTATLTFNQALISQSSASANAGMQSMVPQPVPQPMAQPQQGGVGVPAVPQYTNPNVIKQAGVPTLPTPPPRVRGVIQRKPNPAAGAIAQPDGQVAPVQDE
jgi:hypothetical protein